MKPTSMTAKQKKMSNKRTRLATSKESSNGHQEFEKNIEDYTFKTGRLKRQRKLKSFLFSDMTFVISRNVSIRSELVSEIVDHGGRIHQKLKQNVDFYVQTYLNDSSSSSNGDKNDVDDDDDDDLGIAKVYGIKVVNDDFIKTCISHNCIVDIHLHAVGYFENKVSNKNDEFQIPSTIYDDLFHPICQGSREELEQPQTFGEFMKMERYYPDENRNMIYLVEIGTSLAKVTCEFGSLFDIFRHFLSSYFMMEVKILTSIPFHKGDDLLLPINNRSNKGKRPKDMSLHIANYLYPIHVQYSPEYKINRLNVMDLILVLEEQLPKDGFCILGVTAGDIYELEDDESVLMGRATGDRAGVVSLFRFMYPSPSKSIPTITLHIFLQFLKTATHEVMHMFGLDHCIYYSCVMNACVSSEDDQVDGTEEMQLHCSKDTIFLCPIDLKKLHHSIRFDVFERYNRLLEFFKKYSFHAERSWLLQRISSLKKKMYEEKF